MAYRPPEHTLPDFSAGLRGLPAADAAAARIRENGLTSDEIAKVKIDKLEQLETELKGKLAKSNTLTTRFEEDMDLVRNSSIDSLNDNLARNEKSKPLKGSKGLEDRQNQTKAFFDAELKKLKESETLTVNQIKEIRERLAEIHKVRQTLLTKALNKEDEARLEHAFSRFKGYTGYNPLSDKNLTMVTQQKKTASFLDLINATATKTINWPGGSITLRGNSLVSNDPVALGLAIAAAGYKSIEITSGNPHHALTTAEAAIRAGVYDIEFDEATRNRIFNAHLYRTPAEADIAAERYHSIIKMRDAVVAAQQQQLNSAFNKDVTPLNNLQLEEAALRRINPNEQGHRAIIQGMDSKDQVSLALEWEDQGVQMIKHEKGKDVVYNAKDYIQSLLYNPIAKKNFTQEYDNRQNAARVAAVKTNMAAINQPQPLADLIANERNPQVRQALYGELKNSAAAAPIRNETLAILLGGLIDKHFKEAQKKTIFPKGGVIKAFKKEFLELLNPIKASDLAEVRDYFHDNLNRVHLKAGKPAAAGTAADPLKVTADAAFFGQPEIPGSESLIKSKSDLDLYKEFIKAGQELSNQIEASYKAQLQHNPLIDSDEEESEDEAYTSEEDSSSDSSMSEESGSEPEPGVDDRRRPSASNPGDIPGASADHPAAASSDDDQQDQPSNPRDEAADEDVEITSRPKI